MPRRRSGKKIDFLHWAYNDVTFAAQSAGTSAQTLFAAQHLPETIMRMRGEALIYGDGNLVPPKDIIVGLGIILVPEGTGTTVLWSPLTDGDAPWIWHNAAGIAYEEYVADVIADQVAIGYRSTIDSKAMRIVKNMEIQCVMENQTGGAAMNANAVVTTRVLAGT